MKKSTLALVLIFLFTANCGLKAGIVEKVYNINEIKASQKGEYSYLTTADGIISSEPGKPGLPWFRVSLLLPPGEKAVYIEVIREGKVDIPGNYKLYPFQPPQKLSEGKTHGIIIDKQAYESKLPYPSKPQGNLLTQSLNGFVFAISSFTPAEYIPAEGRFSYYKKVSVRIHTAPVDRPANITRHDRQALERVKRFAQNPEITDLYPAVTETTTDYEILIITPSLFIDSFSSLIDLYYIRGFKTKVKDVSWIYGNISGSDNQEKIRNYIIQEYQNNNIDHVILAGDVELIPYRGFTDSVSSQGSWTVDYDIPADIYYSALDGSWNNDGDQYWGESNEMDLLPEISVGRIPAGNANELASILNKTIKYQDKPVIADLRKPFLAGEHLWDNPDTEGGDYLDLLIGYHTDNGYLTNGITSWHNIQKLYDNLLPSEWTKTMLLANINEGHSFIHHVGHANSMYVMRMTTNDITNANFSSVNGTTHGFMPVYTHGCVCGAFDVDDCIGEKMVIINNFACAFVGNSRYGWFNEGSTDGPSEHLHREFVDALYSDREPSIGMAHSISKIMASPYVTAPGQWEPGALRWVFYDCNVLGDPVMHVWTDLPLDISAYYPDSLLVSSTGFTCSADTSGTPVEGLHASLFQSNVMIASVSTNAYGQAVFAFPGSTLAAGTAQLVISGYDCLPDTLTIVVADTIFNQKAQWTGAVSADWSNAANWSNGLPDPATDIVIGPSAHNPLINSHTTIRSLTMKPGCHLSLNPNKFLTVNGLVCIENEEGLIIKSDSTGSGSFIPLDTTIIYNNGGSARVEQYVKAGINNYLSPPVTGLTRQSAFGGADVLYTWDATTGSLQQLTIDTTSLEIMRGYIVKYAATQILSFTGRLNTGTQAAGSPGHITLAGVSGSGWNLTGNPYSSAVDAGTDSLPNSGWTIGSGIRPFVCYGKSDGNIAYFSKSGAGTGVNGGNRFIPQSRAYWIYLDGSANINYQSTNQVCTHNSQNTYNYTNNTTQVFRIKAFHNTYSDEAVVGFYDQADTLTDKFDITKMLVNDTNFAMVYTLAGNERLALNGLPSLNTLKDTTLTIALGFKCLSAGNFSFTADLSQLDTGILVQLEDTQTGIIRNLATDPEYIFQSGVVETTGRFKLHFTPARIRGKMTYSGNNHPFGNIQLELRDTSGNVIESTYTDLNGNFSFRRFSSSPMKINAIITLTHGGVNSIDALLTLKHFVHLQTLTGLPLKAADVNSDNQVNSIDALMIQKRFVLMLNSFPAGDWLYECQEIQPLQRGEQKNTGVTAICTGDVNTSFIP